MVFDAAIPGVQFYVRRYVASHEGTLEGGWWARNAFYNGAQVLPKLDSEMFLSGVHSCDWKNFDGVRNLISRQT